ncbi:MAG: homoserine dehydrogenase [Clostridia bacterium]|nr:homoserine dehydrogenase [Clostridia bacterium]
MKIAILGFGTVGRGAYETVLAKAGCAVEVKKILDVRVPEGYEKIVTTDYNEILNDPEIETVAEAIGGLHPAYEFLTAALKAGKNVVSANKHLICTYYKELLTLAKEVGKEIRFTPSVGGGIPWLYNLKRTLGADTVTSIVGIMNGTTNYILDSMQNRGIEFAEALAEAQKLGYAELDPTADIDGLDVRRKCAISASIAFDTVLGESDVPTFGIRNVTKADIERADSMDCTLKLLAFAETKNGEVSATVEPFFCKKSSVEASIRKNFNCITLIGEKAGPLSFVGQGAGKDPTGLALVLDCIDIAQGNGKRDLSLSPVKINGEIHPHGYYIRTTAKLQSEAVLHVLDGAYITKPLSPVEIHKIIDELSMTDKAPFVAGLEV